MTLAVNIAQGGSNNVTMRNRIINGAMLIDQRNGGTAVTPTGDQYLVDRWQAAISSAPSWFTFQQNSGTAPTTQGFSQCLKILSTGANTPASGTIYVLQQRIEGYNVIDFAFGTSGAKSVTLSFWVNASVAGTYGVVLANSGITRSYAATYTISSANTWTYITTTVVGDTSGTWVTDTGIGMRVIFDLGTGTSNSISATGAWQTTSGNAYGVTGATKLSSTNGATMYITGVQLEAGTAASPFEYRQYGTELALCQRYYCFWGGVNTSFAALAMWNLNANVACARMFYPVTMRAAPTMTYTGTINTDIRLYYAGAYITMSSFTPASDTSKDSFRIDANVSSGIVSGGASGLYISTTAGSIIASAEL